MAFFHITIKLKPASALLAFSFLLSAFSTMAQTYVSAPMTGTPLAGAYYSNSSLVLSPVFSFTATSGHSLSLYTVNSDCVPQTTALSANQNYILTSVPRVGGITTVAGLANRNTCELMQSVQYFDGLGRSLQSIQIKGSPLGKDVVQPFAYDALGRESQKYLPYAATTADGSYKADALTPGAGLLNFYYPAGSTTPASGSQQSNGIVYNPQPMSLAVFEPSPLNRLIEQGAPGTDWQPVAGSITGHTMKMVYTSNNYVPLSDTANSMLVLLYTATVNTDHSRTLFNNNGAAYLANQLSVTILRDENWKSGKGGTTEEYKDKKGHVVLKRTFNYTGGVLQFLSTYYVYDDFGQLAFVLPPMSNADNVLPIQPMLDNLCYQYRYDEQNRVVQKKIPGKAWEYTVYNKQDQPVLSQDAAQRATNQWKVTKYDALGRVIMTGLWNAGSVITQTTLQANIYAGAQWDTRNTADVTTGYTVTSYPALSSYLSINYYDSYTGIPGLPLQYSMPSGGSTKTVGLPTASKTNILGTSNMLWDVNYYDGLGRSIQSYKQHNLGGGTPNAVNYDVISSTYDFTNAVMATTRQHYNITNTSSPIVTIGNTYVYDHVGRKIKTFEQINSGTNVLLSQLDYNEIGQLQTKHLHSETGAAPFLQDIGYSYNERGWLRTEGTTANLFNFELRYNSSADAISKQYNGNIAEMLYSGPVSAGKTFIYNYDQLNRLNKATSTGSLLDEQLTYDLQGNIMSLVRSGNSSASLAYTYQNGNLSNQLQTVLNNGSAFKTYAYDANGNATSDGGSKAIVYNLLNLPKEVDQGSTALATYTYDANGQKLRNTGSDGSWDYISGIVYNNNAIQFIQTEEGRAIPNGGSYYYEYDLKDNLGNVRVSFDKNPTTGVAREIQEDQYYSFGLRNLGGYNFSNNNRYLYNGKEVQTDLNNQYDYGARFYDPVIGRWNTIDPLAEKSRRWSPYNYVENNPIRLIDPDGMNVVYNPDGSETYNNEGGSDDATNYLWGLKIAGETTREGRDKIRAEAQAAAGFPLSKKDLLAYVSNLYSNLSNGQLENITGRLFEDAWNRSAIASGFGEDNYEENKDPMTGGIRTTVPDGTADGIIQTPFWESNIIVSKAAWFEVKAKNGNIYNSTDTWQILGHLGNLAASVPSAYLDYGDLHATAASLTFVTTSNVKIASSVINTAAALNIILYQYKANYQMRGGVMYVSFQSSVLNGIRVGSTGHTTKPVPLTQ